jgi:predicted oxidoreductase
MWLFYTSTACSHISHTHTHSTHRHTTQKHFVEKKMVKLLILICALLAIWSSSAAVVPQVPLCDTVGCPTVSALGMGTLHLGDKIGGLSDATKINAWITAAVDLGITLFDTADVYPVKGGTAGDAAKLLGQALALTPGLREKVTSVAKTDIIFPSAIDTSSSYLNGQVNWFLESLQTSYIDILLLHYPNSFMNATEVRETFVSLKSSGKVRHFGVSNHYPSHIEVLQKNLDAANTGIRLVTNEVELSVWNPRYFNYNNVVADHAIANGYKMLGWGGLAGDPLGGLNRLFQKTGTRQIKINHALSSVGDAIGCKDNAIVALAWLLSHPSGSVVPLIGTTQISRVQSLVTAFNYVGSFNSDHWWSIGSAGGLCQLADTQCDYEGLNG